MARKELIDLVAVMDNIPTIMGLDLKRTRNGWQGGYYLNREKHPYRRDKLKVWIWDYNIWIAEEGGSAMSLQTWLCTYAGAADYKEAYRIMRGNAIPLPYVVSERERIEGRYVDETVFAEYCRYDLSRCNLFNFMCRLFGQQKVMEAWARYYVTSTERGDTCFWYVNNEGKICHDKIVRYKWDGHRSKDFGGFRRFKTSHGYSERCAFGAHLIESDDEIINIVESEKSAMMAYMAYGGIWIAVGGKGQLRDVDERTRLWPDIDAAEDWASKGDVVLWWDGEDVGEKWDIGDLIEKKIKKGELKIL